MKVVLEFDTQNEAHVEELTYIQNARKYFGALVSLDLSIQKNKHNPNDVSHEELKQMFRFALEDNGLDLDLGF